MIGMGQNLYDALVGDLSRHGPRIAIETSTGQQFTYGDLDQQSARLANVLAACGVVLGDRVAVQVEKSPQAVFLYLACLRAGAIYLPLNTAYTRDETDYFIADAEPKVMICLPDRHSELADLCGAHSTPHTLTLGPAGEGSLIEKSRAMPTTFRTVATSGDDLAAILYSSGTTGKPKGVMLTHHNLLSNVQALVEAWGFTDQDVLLHALPLFHVHGLFVALHCALLSRARLLFLPRYDAQQICSLLPRSTVFMGVPTYYTRLLAHPQFNREICGGMRLFVSGSAPLLPDTFAHFQARTGHAILERYGMTETSMNTSNPLEGPRVPGSVGKPLPGIEARIADQQDQPVAVGAVGEIQVRGPNVFCGYWRRPELSSTAFTSDGFFRTGDLGSVDANGYFSIVGRGKDLIISGGFNVYPKEVEDCINALDGVQESAVIGMPHPDFGEAVMAIVVPRPGAAVDAETIKPLLRRCLAGYKLPKLVALADELPRNTMGKVQKNRLRESFLPLWQEHMAKGHGGGESTSSL
jgi:malonyl-CoA/methylmalonyl-CoA synthetase